MVDRIDCEHFEYNYFEDKGRCVKISTCKIGKMKGTEGCQEYCEWFELKESEIPSPSMPLGTPEPSDSLSSP